MNDFGRGLISMILNCGSVSSGQLVGIMLPNCLDWIIADYALSSFGLVSLAIHLSYDDAKLLHVLQSTGVETQTFALAESFGCVTSTLFGDHAPTFGSSIGTPIPGIELKLCNVSGFGVTDTPNPRGEICIRGNLMQGYYRDDSKATDSDGWFHTSYIGVLYPNRTVALIGNVALSFPK